MRMPQGWEFLIIAGLVLVLFGAKRLPDAARGLGRSLRIFKAETRALTDDAADTTTAPAVAATPVVETKVEANVEAKTEKPAEG